MTSDAACRDDDGPLPVHGSAPGPALDAPVRSFKMLELQIAAGATEIHLALRAPGRHAFDALPGTRDGEPTQVASRALLGELVSAAHDAGLLVHFCADAPIVTADDEKAYRRHVDAGRGAGADTVVVGSLATCSWLSGTDAPVLVAGQHVGLTGTALAEHLRDAYGVRRVVLPHSSTLSEVAAFCRLPRLVVEVPVQTGSGLDCTRCRLSDDPVVGLGCRAGYDGTVGDGTPVADLEAVLDGAVDCALCDVPTLAELGVAALRIPGRESPNLRQNAKITQLYRRVLDGYARGVGVVDLVEEIDRTELMWQMGWVPRLCDVDRCRFRDTAAVRAYVGRADRAPAAARSRLAAPGDDVPALPGTSSGRCP